jgi:flagellar biosynthetic protein FlhB
MEDSEQGKTEAPTPFKLIRARRKGSVARGVDLGFFTGLTAFLGFAWVAGPSFGRIISQSIRGALIEGGTLADGHYAVLSVVALLFSSVVPPLVLLAGTIFLVVLLFEILQSGIVFSAEPLKPDFNRLNPTNGFKRVFSLRMLFETGKNVLKAAIYTTVAWLVIRGALRNDIGAITDARSLSALLSHTALRLLGAFVLVAFVFAVLDQIIVRRDFLKKMMMSRRELRREAREREGDPRLKQKRKQMHAEFVKASKSLRGMRSADVLVTNPEHIAIGLRYDPRTMEAPLVVSAGTSHLAQRLKRLAFIYGIPIIENRVLARELYRKSNLDKPIPEHCFCPVADIYNAIRRKSGAGDAEQLHVQEHTG